MATFNVVCIILFVGGLSILGTNATIVSSTYLQSFCINKTGGLYVYIYSCSQYIQCSNGIAYLSNCPGGLYFNSNTQTCDWPVNLSQDQITACSQPTGLIVVEQAATGKAIVSCPAGYYLLSCTFANSQTTNRDPFRQSVPINSTSCACSDIYGFLCIARCAAVQLQDFEIVSTAVIRRYGHVAVACPIGKKLLGCHIAFDDGYGSDYQSASGGSVGVMPSESSCMCYQPNGGNCVATCASASSVIDLEVPSTTGNGAVTKLCSPGKFVIGVGFVTVDSMDNQSFPYARFLENSFQASYCYHPGNSVYCSAICGKFTNP